MKQHFLLQPGDEILSTDLEYAACIANWGRVCQRRSGTLQPVAIALLRKSAKFVDHLLDPPIGNALLLQPHMFVS